MSDDYSSMTTADFAERYRMLSDDDITQLASEGGLRPEADVALKAELHRRSIGADDVAVLREKQEKTKLQMQAGHNPYSSFRGTGLQLRGCKFLTESDRSKRITVATRWIMFAFMPLIPIGSYRVKSHSDDNDNAEIISKVPLQWDQVLAGWKTALLVLLGMVGVLLAIAWWAEKHG